MNLVSAFNQYKGLPREIYIITIQRFVNSLGGFVYPLLTMYLSKRLGFDEDRIGLFMLITATVCLPGSLLSGYFVDRIGRKTILIASRTISAIIFIICGFLGNTILVPYLIILASFFSSFSGPASGAMITDLTVPENRKQSLSLLYLGMNVGLAFGFLFAGILFENHTEWLFWGDGITSLLSLSLVIFWIKDTRPSKDEIKNINQSNRIDEREENSGVFISLLKKPYLLCFVFLCSIIGFIYSQHSFIMPLQLEELFIGQGASYYSYVMAVNTVMVIIFTPFIMHITKKYKPILNVITSVFTYIIGFGMLAFSSTLLPFLLAAVIWSTGEIIGTVNVGVYISNHSPVNQRGRFNSVISIIRFSGQAFAPLIMGSFLMSHSMAQGWLLTAGVSILVFVLLILLFISERRHIRKRQSKKQLQKKQEMA